MRREVLVLAMGLAAALLVFPVFATGQQGAAETGKPVTLTIWTHSNVETFPAGMNENDNPVIAYLEEKTGYDLEWMIGPQENALAKVSMMLASGNTPDLMSPIGKDMFGELVNQRVLLPLDDLIDSKGAIFMNEEVVPSKLWLAAKFEGAIYGVPQQGAVQSQGGPLMRKDWLDEAGMAPPKTVDDYYAVLKKFKALYPDSIPMSGETYGIRGSISPFGGHFDCAVTYMEKGEKVVDTRVTSDQRDYLAFLRQLYEEGLLDQEYMINKGKNVNEKVAGGKVGLFSASPWGLRDLLPAFEENNPGGEYIFIDPAVDSEGRVGVRERNPIRGFALIPADAKHPEEAFDFLAQYASSSMIQDFVSYGEKGVHYSETDDGLKEVLPEGEERKYNIYYVIWNTPEAHLDRAKLKGFWPTYQPTFKYSVYSEITSYAPLIQEYEEVKTQLSDLTEEMFDKIIVGALPMDAFDDYVKQWNQLGGQKALDAIDAWYQSTK
jgi:putative aldouronate transport system substrate-binding protein